MMVRGILALHVTADVCLVAGLLATWLIYACRASTSDPAFEPLAQKLVHLVLTRVTNAALGAATLTGGLLLALNPGLLQAPWMWLKLALLAALFGLHGMASAYRRRLKADPRVKPSGFFWRAGLGTAAVSLGILVAVLVRPF